jgi:adenylate cyclase
MFEKAIEIDKNYALAYAGISDSYSEAYMYYDKSEENLQHTLQYSKKALLLDPELAEAHSARGYALTQNNQYEEAEKEFKRAIQLNPKLFVAYYYYGRMLRSLGKHEKAVIQFKKATEIEPNNYQPWMFFYSAYKNLNLETEMLKARKQAIKVVRKHLDFNPDDARALYLGAIALVDENERTEGILWLEKSISINPEEISVLYNAACLYSILKETDKALNYLDKAVKAGFASRNWLDNDSDLDNIRNHPRFKTIINNIKD